MDATGAEPASSPLAWLAKKDLRITGAAVLVTALLTLPLPFLSASRYGDLSNWYSDHLHHCYATWVFLHRGLLAYTVPFRQSAAGVAYPHPVMGSWGNNPAMVYPPGVFVVFLPATLLGWLVAMPTQTFGAWNIAILLAIAYAALGCFFTSLQRQPPGSRLLVGAALWLILMRAALNGFFDVAWLGAAAAMQLSLMQRKPERALVWFGIAAFTHFRALGLAPLALAAFQTSVRGRPLREWPWASLTVTATLGVVSLATFFLMYPVASAGMGASHPPLSSQLGTLAFWSLVLVGAAIAYGTFRAGGPFAMATSVIVTLVAVSELSLYRTYWWHSSICVAMFVLPGALPAMRSPSMVRQLGLIQLFATEALLWADKQGGTFGLLTQIVTDYKLR